jgi:peptidyl-prolyl cis-trans isomerase B (cyclophilin B)
MKKFSLFFAVLLAMGLTACANSTEKEVSQNYQDGTPVVDATSTTKSVESQEAKPADSAAAPATTDDTKPAVAPSNPTPTMAFDQTAKPTKGEQIVVIKTNMGTIKLRLFPDKAPKTVENFEGLIKKKYYDGLIFHRVIPGFMIQGGDPKGDGTGGESLWGGVFDSEISPDLHHIRGALSMANAGPNTNGSQFFIVQKDSQFLDGGYSIFGQAFEGMDIVDKIVAVKRDGNDKPLSPVKMEKVTLEKF